jgi:nicotinamidase-related amidase
MEKKLSKLTAANSLVILIDYQPGLLMNCKNMEPLTIKNNVVAFAKALKVLNVPIILSMQTLGGFGPVTKDLANELVDIEQIDRTIIDVWKNPTIRKMIEESGRPNIIIGGITLEVCAMFPALSLLAAGYQVYTVMDICGSQSDDIARWAELRLVQAGAIPLSFTAVLMEMMADNAGPQSGAVYGALSESWGLPKFFAEYNS